MAMLDEFKKFAMRGNVVDLAVGVVIGSAFGKVTTSFVDDVLTPPLGLLIGGVDFSGLAVTPKAAEGEAPAVLWKYGAFIQSIVDFAIIAFAIFLVVKAMNAMQKTEEAAPTAPAPEVVLLTEIRDTLQRRGA
jgi:large conductance mechanosensitive channel